MPTSCVTMCMYFSRLMTCMTHQWLAALLASVIGLPTGQSVVWIVSNTNPVIGAISIYCDEYIAHVKLPGIYVLQVTQSRFKLSTYLAPAVL